jgi:hypothetical protein
MLLQFLILVLPDKYAITVATLDAQQNLSVQDKLVALHNREDVLQVAKAIEDKALAAKQSLIACIAHSIPNLILVYISRSKLIAQVCDRSPNCTLSITSTNSASHITNLACPRGLLLAVIVLISEQSLD